MLHLIPPLALLLVPVSGPHAAVPALQEAVRGLDTPAQGPTRSMILELEDGRFLRGRMREVSGGYELRSGKRWIFLPAPRVRDARLEQEVLRDAKLLERKIDREDWVRRSAHGDWLFRHGLAVEGLRAFDEILAADPAQPAALAVLARCDELGLIPLALPDPTRDLDAFLEQMERKPGAGPASLVVGASRLARSYPDAENGTRTELEERLRADLVSSDSGRRGFAALALGIAFPGLAERELVRRSVLDVDDGVRRAATVALTRAEDPAAVEASWLGALASKSPTLRTNALESLELAGSPKAVAPLVRHLSSLSSSRSGRSPHSNIYVGSQRAYVSDFDVEVATNSAIADPVINVLVEGSVLDAAVIGTHSTSAQRQLARERGAACRALQRLTGADPGGTARAWERWWREHGSEYPATDERNNGAGEPASPRTGRDP
ncbi:MAG TPA: hypothetical protein ENJ09_11840 [Planctomycetes bacterium]|nr:hypothetical protein [Planctomycetota bacterium]